jgi:MFS family permease
VLIGMTVCLGALFVAVDLATIAFAARHGDKAAAGPLLGLYGLGSAAAGVWYGSRRWRAPYASRLTAALAATVLGVAPLGVVPGIWPMAIAIAGAGLGISATLASSYRIAEMAVPAGQRTEAMSWLTTAAATGTALGAPLAGHLIDLRGAPAGYLFAFTAGLAAVAIALLGRHRLTAPPGHPDMKASDAAPGHRPTDSPGRGRRMDSGPMLRPFNIPRGHRTLVPLATAATGHRPAHVRGGQAEDEDPGRHVR